MSTKLGEAQDVVERPAYSGALLQREAIPAGFQPHVASVVLRELQTLSGHPDRLHEWTCAAIEMAAKYA